LSSTRYTLPAARFAKAQAEREAKRSV
jgi:hypothetical protein